MRARAHTVAHNCDMRAPCPRSRPSVLVRNTIGNVRGAANCRAEDVDLRLWIGSTHSNSSRSEGGKSSAMDAFGFVLRDRVVTLIVTQRKKFLICRASAAP